MAELSAALEQAKALDVDELAATIRAIGFECTRCGACCRGTEDAAHTATIYPDEIRRIRARTDDRWRDVARPMPYGLEAGEGETFEWALQTDDCGDCRYLHEDDDGGTACSIYEDRPLICRTYPFQVDVTGTTAPAGEVVDRVDDVLAYECEGLGRDIDPADARALAETLKRRTIADIQQAMRLLEGYRSADPVDGIVVHDSEGAKRRDGTPYRSE